MMQSMLSSCLAIPRVFDQNVSLVVPLVIEEPYARACALDESRTASDNCGLLVEMADLIGKALGYRITYRRVTNYENPADFTDPDSVMGQLYRGTSDFSVPSMEVSLRRSRHLNYSSAMQQNPEHMIVYRLTGQLTPTLSLFSAFDWPTWTLIAALIPIVLSVRCLMVRMGKSARASHFLSISLLLLAVLTSYYSTTLTLLFTQIRREIPPFENQKQLAQRLLSGQYKAVTFYTATSYEILKLLSSEDGNNDTENYSQMVQINDNKDDILRNYLLNKEQNYIAFVPIQIWQHYQEQACGLLSAIPNDKIFPMTFQGIYYRPGFDLNLNYSVTQMLDRFLNVTYAIKYRYLGNSSCNALEQGLQLNQMAKSLNLHQIRESFLMLCICYLISCVMWTGEHFCSKIRRVRRRRKVADVSHCRVVTFGPAENFHTDGQSGVSEIQMFHLSRKSAEPWCSYNMEGKGADSLMRRRLPTL